MRPDRSRLAEAADALALVAGGLAVLIAVTVAAEPWRAMAAVATVRAWF